MLDLILDLLEDDEDDQLIIHPDVGLAYPEPVVLPPSPPLPIPQLPNIHHHQLMISGNQYIDTFNAHKYKYNEWLPLITSSQIHGLVYKHNFACDAHSLMLGSYFAPNASGFWTLQSSCTLGPLSFWLQLMFIKVKPSSVCRMGIAIPPGLA